MQKVTVRKVEVLEILRANKAQHRQTFEEAVEGYRARAIEELERRLADVRAKRFVSVYVSLPMPEDHSDDYDRVIKMVEMSVTDDVELTSQEFAQFVMDDWTWKQEWTATANSYGAGL